MQKIVLMLKLRHFTEKNKKSIVDMINILQIRDFSEAFGVKAVRYDS